MISIAAARMAFMSSRSNLGRAARPRDRALLVHLIPIWPRVQRLDAYTARSAASGRMTAPACRRDSQLDLTVPSVRFAPLS